MKSNTATRRQRVLLFLMSAALLVGLGAAGMCPASMPIGMKSDVSMGGLTRAIVVSPTEMTTKTPSGVMTACQSAYVAVYTYFGSCIGTVVTKPSASPTGDGCRYTATSEDGGSYNFDVQCDSSADGLVIPASLNRNRNDISGTLTSSSVCGSSGGIGGGGCTWGCVFLILLLLGVVGYCAGTVVFYYVKQGKRGKELIPHVEFWVSFPGLVKTGAQFSMSKVRSKGNADAYRETL